MNRAGVALLVCLAPVPLLCQPLAPPQPTRVFGGAYFIGAGPTGYFGRVVSSSDALGGVGGHVSLTPRAGLLGARFETTFLQYGTEDTAVPIESGSDPATSTTTNMIFRFSAGPVVMLRHGSVRPYAFATVGTSWFRTATLVKADCDASCDSDDYFRVVSDETNASDWTFSWSAGGGLLVPVGRHGSIDVGVRYVANSAVKWLAQGDVMSDASGRVEVPPRYSPVNLVEVTLGWTFGR